MDVLGTVEVKFKWRGAQFEERTVFHCPIVTVVGYRLGRIKFDIVGMLAMTHSKADVCVLVPEIRQNAI